MPQASLTITMRGVNRVRNNLRRLASDMDKITDRELGDWTRNEARKLKAEPYPPRLPHQRYVRTGRLANSWKVVKIKDKVWKVVNEAQSPLTGEKYAARVVGDERGQGQGPLFIKRWWRARDIIERDVNVLTKSLSKKLMTVATNQSTPDT